ncbi:hypothetical protein T484DRAFT_1867149, partial [Baffinella frigidus]
MRTPEVDSPVLWYNSFDSSHKRNKPFSFKIGVGQGVIKMSIGEKAKLLISSDF